MFTAYSTQGQLKPRPILAEGFWDGLIQPAAYLGRESVRISVRVRFRISFPIFFDQLITWEPNTNLDWRNSLKWKRQRKKQRFLRAKASRLAFLLAQATVARCKRNYPKTRHQNKLRHHWTDLAAN